MPSRIWRTTESSWDAPALLKRIYVDVSGRARGYIKIEGEGGPLYYAGSAPHLTEMSEREARRNPRPASARDDRDPAGGSPVQRDDAPSHRRVRGKEVREFRPHLLNAIVEEEG